jgi:hypothetical protein
MGKKSSPGFMVKAGKVDAGNGDWIRMIVKVSPGIEYNPLALSVRNVIGSSQVFIIGIHDIVDLATIRTTMATRADYDSCDEIASLGGAVLWMGMLDSLEVAYIDLSAFSAASRGFKNTFLTLTHGSTCAASSRVDYGFIHAKRGQSK